MVLEGDVGLAGALRWVAAVGLGAVVLGVVLGLVVRRVRHRRVGVGGAVLGTVVVVAAGAVAVVADRQRVGDATGWDRLWATALTVAGVLAVRRLWRSGRPLSGRQPPCAP